MSNEVYNTILTKTGAEKITEAIITGSYVNLTEFAVGSGKSSVNEHTTQLGKEEWRGNVQRVEIDSVGLNRISTTVVIPAEVGGFTITEIGIFDDEGDLIIVGNFPATPKPGKENGLFSDFVIELITEVGNIDSMVVEINPSAVYAFKTDIEDHAKKLHEVDSRHGLRLTEDYTLEVETEDGEFVSVSPSDPIKVGEAKNFTADMVTGTVHISYEDPEDVIVTDNSGNDVTISKWAETIVVRTEGEIGARSIEDGVVVIKSNVRDEFKETPYIDLDVEIDKTYTYTIFTVSSSKAITKGDSLDVLVLEVDPVPTDPVSSFTTKSLDGKVELLITDPGTEEWVSTRIVRTIKEPATTVKDGDLILDNRIRNKYKDTPFIDNTVKNGVEYYYTAFTTSNTGGISQGTWRKANPSEAKIWGVMIDTKNANPESRVQYTDDAVGFRPVRGNNGNVDWGSWRDTSLYDKVKPCVVKNGKVQYYLDKNDLTKKATGGNAVLTGADGDVMIEISKLWVSIRRNTDGLYVRVSDGYQPGFSNMAFKNGDKEVEKIYVARYLGYEQNGKLRSISGVEPTGDKTIGAFRELAEANGENYHLVPFQPLTLLQSIMVVMLRSTDTQTALGRGYVDMSSSDPFLKTGGTNSKGMMYGETSGKDAKAQLSFLGIEDFWGNKRWWIDGCKYDDGIIKLATNNFNNEAKDYISAGEYEKTGGGYIKDVMGGDLTGFIPKDLDGSDSTYYCDYGYVYDGGFPDFGGSRSGGSSAGGFALSSSSDSYSGSILGARLFMYGE